MQKHKTGRSWIVNDPAFFVQIGFSIEINPKTNANCYGCAAVSFLPAISSHL